MTARIAARGTALIEWLRVQAVVAGDHRDRAAEQQALDERIHQVERACQQEEIGEHLVERHADDERGEHHAAADRDELHVERERGVGQRHRVHARHHQVVVRVDAHAPQADLARDLAQRAGSVATAVPLRWITSTAAISGPTSRSTTQSSIFTASAASAFSTSIT